MTFSIWRLRLCRLLISDYMQQPFLSPCILPSKPIIWSIIGYSWPFPSFFGAFTDNRISQYNLLLSFPLMRTLSIALLLHIVSCCISSQGSLSDDSHLFYPLFYARASSVSPRHSIYIFLFLPYSRILIRPDFPAIPTSMTFTAPALPFFSHNI